MVLKSKRKVRKKRMKLKINHKRVKCLLKLKKRLRFKSIRYLIKKN